MAEFPALTSESDLMAEPGAVWFTMKPELPLKLTSTVGVPEKPGAVDPSIVVVRAIVGSGLERTIVPLVEKATVLPLFVFADEIAFRREPGPELLVLVTVKVAAKEPVAKSANGRADPRRSFFIREVNLDAGGPPPHFPASITRGTKLTSYFIVKGGQVGSLGDLAPPRGISARNWNDDLRRLRAGHFDIDGLKRDRCIHLRQIIPGNHLFSRLGGRKIERAHRPCKVSPALQPALASG